jgi:hypothetical protein
MRYWIFVFSACILLLGSCNDTIPVGSEILPGGDGQGNFFNDTTTIYSSTVREDSLRSDRLFLAQLGIMSDPIFGTTKSSLLINFRTPNGVVSPAIFDTVGGYTLDSIVLALTVNSVYGDTTNLMGFKVYKMLAPLNAEEIYYSNIEFNQGMVEVGSIVNYAPTLSNEYSEDTTFEDLGHQLRIKLNPFFGQSIINNLGTDQLSSNELLSQFLPGLVIVPNNTSGSMLEIDMIVNTSSTSKRVSLEDSRMQIYFKNSLDSALSIIFPATILNVGVSKFEHNYNGTNVESALNLNNPLGDEVNYLQGLAGVKTKIELPFLANYDTIAIRKAELVITQILDGNETTFKAPERILLVKIGEDGENVNTSDFKFFQSSHSGGFGEETTLTNGDKVMVYKVNISDQIQRMILNQEENNGFYITLYAAQDTELVNLNSSDLIPDRIVIGGGRNASPEYKLKLELTYTILE